MRKKTQPKSSADVTESESNSSDAMPTTSQNYFDDSDGVQTAPEAHHSEDNDSKEYQPSRKRKIVVQRQDNNRSSSEEIDSDEADNKCVFTIQRIA